MTVSCTQYWVRDNAIKDAKVQKCCESIERRYLREDIDTFLDGCFKINRHQKASFVVPVDKHDVVTAQCVLEKVQKISDSIERSYLRNDIDILRCLLKHESSLNNKPLRPC